MTAVPPPNTLDASVMNQASILDDQTDPNTGKSSEEYPEQLPGEDNLKYSIRVADVVPINYTWALLGSVPYKTGPPGLFAPFKYAELRTMLQRKHLTQN